MYLGVQQSLLQILFDTACFITPECRKDVFSVTVPLVQTFPTTHVLHKRCKNEVSRWTTFTTTPFPDCNMFFIQIFMTTISPLMLQYNNFIIYIAVQGCVTISFLSYLAWKHQWLIIIVQQIALFDPICTPFFS